MKLIIIVLVSFIFINPVNSNTLEIYKKQFEKGLLTEQEYIVAKKLIISKNKNKNKNEKVKKVKKNLKIVKKNIKKSKEDPIEIKDINDLGSYRKLNIDDYPKDMYDFLNKGCKSNICLAKQATKSMANIFGRSPRWAEKNPGQLIKAMGYYELFYWNNLNSKKNSLKRYIERIDKKYLRKKLDKKNIRSLISMNKGRKKMRAALGMKIDLPIDEALQKYWILGSFLDLGVGKDLKKLSPELKKRRNLLDEYKTKVSNLKTLLENDKK